MRNRHHSSGDSESLQADVMRFMAIIGFCLIAILGLVRNVEQKPSETAPDPQIASVEEPPAPQTSEPAPRPTVSPEPEPSPQPPIFVPPPAERTIVIRPPAAVPQPPAPPPAAEPIVEVALAEPEPEAEPRPDETPAPTSPEIVPPTPKNALAEAVEPTPEPVAAEPAAPAPEQQGLSLRFASDGDFLRLIARGDVTVFALSEGAILGLGQDYAFRAANAPKRIYELHEDTLPTLVNDAFRRDVRGSEQYTWGVSLPHRIEAQIRDYVDRVEQGVLLIDRFGDVRHVSNS